MNSTRLLLLPRRNLSRRKDQGKLQLQVDRRVEEVKAHHHLLQRTVTSRDKLPRRSPTMNLASFKGSGMLLLEVELPHLHRRLRPLRRLLLHLHHPLRPLRRLLLQLRGMGPHRSVQEINLLHPKAQRMLELRPHSSGDSPELLKPSSSLGNRNSNPPREIDTVRRLLIEQQNAAYEASLKADQERAEKKEKELQEKRKAEEEKKAKVLYLLSLKEKARQNLPPEPVPGGGDDGTFTIRFRLSNGLTFKRIFRPSDTLQVLIQVVLGHPESPYPFNVIRRPNQIFTMNPSQTQLDSTLQELGFGVSEVLFVEKEEPVLQEEDEEIIAQQ